MQVCVKTRILWFLTNILNKFIWCWVFLKCTITKEQNNKKHTRINRTITVFVPWVPRKVIKPRLLCGYDIFMKHFFLLVSSIFRYVVLFRQWPNMEARNIPHFGEPVLIQELAVPSQWMHKSVSITGRLSTLSTGGLTESKQKELII